MSKKRFIVLLLAFWVLLFTALPSYAAEEISEADVQSAVDAQGKEAVAGNLLIWFLCATAFLKVSQRMDSFLNMLGVNVGHTGGGAFSDMVVALKSLSGATHLLGGSGSRQSPQRSSSGPAAGSGVFSGGLAGMVSRQAVRKTASQATDEAAGGIMAGLGNKLYERTLNKPQGFAQDVISAIATTDGGMMTGEKAAKAFEAYVGSGITQNSNSAVAEPPFEDYAQTDPFVDTPFTDPIDQMTDSVPSTAEIPFTEDCLSAVYSAEDCPAAMVADGLDVPEVSAAEVFGLNATPLTAPPVEESLASENLATEQPGIDHTAQTFPSATLDSPAAYTAATSYDGITVANNDSEGTLVPSINTGIYPAGIATSSASEQIFTSPEAMPSAASTISASNTSATIPTAPQYRDIEIGRGQIRGVEVSSTHPEGIGFAMYHTGKYLRPEDGPYQMVQTADGLSWYKQYAQPVVKRTPVAEVNGKVKQKERIVYKLPQAPQQKSKI